MAKPKQKEEAQPIGGNAKEELKEYMNRINNLIDQEIEAKETHIAPIKEAIKNILMQAAGNGFDKKALQEVVRKARFSKELRDQIDIYEDAVLADLLD